MAGAAAPTAPVERRGKPGPREIAGRRSAFKQLMLRASLLAAIVLLSGCREDRTPRGLGSVRIGMTDAEVERAAGPPIDKVAAPCGPDSPRYWVYEGTFPSAMTSYVLFVGDHVAEVRRGAEVLANQPERLAKACSDAPRGQLGAVSRPGR